jgi:tRNA(adenine34) deaminase
MGVTPEHWMQSALDLAREAEKQGEVPVGAIVVLDDEIIGRGVNRTISDSDPTAHAEIVAMREAAGKIGNYRLSGASLYSTIEPCTMCAGAMVHARIARLYFGASEPRSGAAGSTINVLANESLNHRVDVEGGVCAEAAAELMKGFFRARRQ